MIDKGLTPRTEMAIAAKLRTYPNLRSMAQSDIQTILRNTKVQQPVGSVANHSFLDLGKAIGVRDFIAGNFTKLAIS